MPFIGRYNTNYPIYPQFGNDPTKFNNICAVVWEQEILNPGQILNYQFKTTGAEIRLYDQAVEFIESEIDYTIFEDATCTDGVTQIPVGTADRNSTFISSVYASSDPTAISGGNTLDGLEHYGLSTPVIGLGDNPPASVNYVSLKLASNYILRFENVGTVPIVDFRVLWLFAE